MYCQNLPFQLPPLSHIFAVHVIRQKKNNPSKPPKAQPTKRTPFHTNLAVQANDVGYQILKTFTPNYLMQAIRWRLNAIQPLASQGWVSLSSC